MSNGEKNKSEALKILEGQAEKLKVQKPKEEYQKTQLPNAAKDSENLATKAEKAPPEFYEDRDPEDSIDEIMDETSPPRKTKDR